MKDDVVLEVNELSKVYETKKGQFKALSNVSFELRKGEILGIIGKNGAGKSTLLKVLSEITAPTSGQVEYEGRMVSILEIGTGFHQDLTGRENVFLNAELLGISKKEIQSKYEEIVRFSELEDFMDQAIKTYSSGMYLRLAFALAFHAELDILVLDEVIAVGDTNFREKCYEYYKQLILKQKSIIMVSHEMSNILNFTQRSILLDQGKMVQIGESQEVVSYYLNKNQATENETKKDSESLTVESDHFFLEKISVWKEGQLSSRTLQLTNHALLEFKIEFSCLKGGASIQFAIEVQNFESKRILFDGLPLRANYKEEKVQTGKYISQVALPSHLLPNGNYSLHILICENLQVLKRISNIGFLQLKVENKASAFQIDSAITPQLEWKLTPNKNE